MAKFKQFKRKNNPLDTKQMGVVCSDVKALDNDAGTFSAYGNVFNVLDHAGDMTVKGAFTNTINKHKQNGTMPKFLAQHEGRMMPVGIITEIREDSKGLYFEGKFCLDTQAGREYHALVKMGAIDQFSIGYRTIDETFDNTKGINYLNELDVAEISIVTFACNEESRVQTVKSALNSGETITERMIQDTIQEALGLSKRQAESAINKIKAEPQKTAKDIDVTDIDTFRTKADLIETNVHMDIGDGEMKTKDLGELSFNQVRCALYDHMIKNIGHNDFYLCDIYKDYGYVDYWDYVERDCKIAKFTWENNDNEINVTSFVLGSFKYSTDFVEETVEEYNEENGDDDDNDGEKDLSLDELLIKSDPSTWFNK